MTRLLLLFGLVLALVVPTVSAQGTTSQDQVLLQMEISKNGSLIAKPSLRMRIGSGKASIAVNGGPTITVESVRHDGVIEAVCDFQFSDGTKPSLRIRLGQEPATAKIQVGKDTFDIKIDLSSPK